MGAGGLIESVKRYLCDAYNLSTFDSSVGYDL